MIAQISGYPKFRDYIENEIITFVQENTLANQNNILSLVKMESAYMNCMHYDFKNDKYVPLVWFQIKFAIARFYLFSTL